MAAETVGTAVASGVDVAMPAWAALRACWVLISAMTIVARKSRVGVLVLAGGRVMVAVGPRASRRSKSRRPKIVVTSSPTSKNRANTNIHPAREREDGVCRLGEGRGPRLGFRLMQGIVAAKPKPGKNVRKFPLLALTTFRLFSVSSVLINESSTKRLSSH